LARTVHRLKQPEQRAQQAEHDEQTVRNDAAASLRFGIGACSMRARNRLDSSGLAASIVLSVGRLGSARSSRVELLSRAPSATNNSSRPSGQRDADATHDQGR